MKVLFIFASILLSAGAMAMDNTINESQENAFARLGMDTHSVSPGVNCNGEIGKSNISGLDTIIKTSGALKN
jgi:hypothetical protein